MAKREDLREEAKKDSAFRGLMKSALSLEDARHFAPVGMESEDKSGPI